MSEIHRKSVQKAFAAASGFKTRIVFPGVWDRDFWEKHSGETLQALIRSGERAAAEPVPVLTLSDYLAYSQTGNRKDFEDKYFLRRQLLSDLVLAECAEHQGRFLAEIRDLLWTILEESAWCLPAHNTYVRDMPALPLPDTENPVIDLFAAETSAILSMSVQMLGEELEKTAPGLRERIGREIRKRILIPYLKTFFWWMGDGVQSTCNWTPWITQNILLSVFAPDEGFCSEKERRQVLRKAAVSVDHYLSDYGEDGCCNEGAFYYGHSGLCLFGCLDLFNRITDDAMRSLYEETLIRNIASYIVHMYAGGGYYINYSDASPHPGHRNAKDYLFALATENPAYASFSAEDFRSLSVADRLLPGERNLYDRLLQLMQWERMEQEPALPLKVPDVFYESVGLLVARDEHWVLAAKAGDNGDSHNHNDIGSVTVYRDGEPFLIDLGVETYTAKTFSDRRYEIWTMQSGYHNTLNFIGDTNAPAIGRQRKKNADICNEQQGGAGSQMIVQRPGKEYAAGGVMYLQGEENVSLTMDTAPAFGEPRIRRAIRKVEFLKGTDTGMIVITDEADSDLTGVLSFMTYEKPESVSSEGDTVRLRIGTLGFLEAEGVVLTAIETCPITDDRLKEAWKHDCYRILLTLTDNRSTVTIR